MSTAWAAATALDWNTVFRRSDGNDVVPVSLDDISVVSDDHGCFMTGSHNSVGSRDFVDEFVNFEARGRSDSASTAAVETTGPVRTSRTATSRACTS